MNAESLPSPCCIVATLLATTLFAGPREDLLAQYAAAAKAADASFRRILRRTRRRPCTPRSSPAASPTRRPAPPATASDPRGAGRSPDRQGHRTRRGVGHADALYRPGQGREVVQAQLQRSARARMHAAGKRRLAQLHDQPVSDPTQTHLQGAPHEHSLPPARPWPALPSPFPPSCCNGPRPAAATTIPPVADPVVKEECGSCHLAFAPSMLPARSWQRMMGDLKNHFGDDASVDAGHRRQDHQLPRRQCRRHGRPALQQQAAARRVRRAALPCASPNCRSGCSEHRKVPAWEWKHKDVRTKANCVACHADAERGYYDD